MASIKETYIKVINLIIRNDVTKTNGFFSYNSNTNISKGRKHFK